MGKIIVTTNMSLDGVIEDPDGEEGFERGGWFATYGKADLAAWVQLETTEALGASAMLLGRNSDQWFASRWTDRPGEWADKLNSLPKYVISSTGHTPQWTNATNLVGDPVAEITDVKASIDGEILVYGSYQLVRTLIDHDLVDELRLVVFPVILGAGKRLFGDTPRPKGLRLVDTQRLGENLTFLRYETTR
jgi:dihydrofolate reductase